MTLPHGPVSAAWTNKARNPSLSTPEVEAAERQISYFTCSLCLYTEYMEPGLRSPYGSIRSSIFRHMLLNVRIRHGFDSKPRHTESVFGKVAPGTAFPPIIFFLPCQYHSNNVPQTTMHLPPTICNLSKWQRRLIKLIQSHNIWLCAFYSNTIRTDSQRNVLTPLSCGNFSDRIVERTAYIYSDRPTEMFFCCC